MRKKWQCLFLAAVMAAPPAGGEILFHCGFDSPEEFARWRSVPGWSHSAGGGRNGTGAAVLTRKDFSGPLTCVKLDSLKPGVLYRLTVWVRPEKPESDGKNRNYGAFCVEFVRNGKWASGYYPQVSSAEGKWRKYELEFVPKPGAEQTTIVLYMRKGFKGTLYFDDVTLEEAGDPRAAILVTAPSQLTFFGTSGTLKISGSSSVPGGKTLDVRISGPGIRLKTLLRESGPGEFILPLKELRPGVLDVRMVLHGGKNDIIAKSDVRLFVRAEGRQKSCFDASGNLCIDGEKFLPIGIFGGFSGADDLKRISDAGFNTIVNYSSFGMTFGGGEKGRMKTIVRALDVVRQHNLKLLFSLKDQYPGMRNAVAELDGSRGIDEVVKHTVNSLKDHPALLGWYVSDENSRSELPAMLALRELISAADPDHPAVTLTFREGDLPVYGSSGDVLAVDNYPIVGKNEKELSPMLKLIRTAKRGKQPVWMVPQIFNWGVYRAKNAEEFAKFVYPERKEIKAMIAAGAILGCKGFLFYSYSDIAGKRGRRFAPENEARQWENTVSAASMLKKLEPFLLADAAPEILVDNGRELAAKFRADSGKTAVVAVRTDFGKSRLRLPADGRYTLAEGSAKFSGGSWNFCGKDIDFCILTEK